MFNDHNPRTLSDEEIEKEMMALAEMLLRLMPPAQAIQTTTDTIETVLRKEQAVVADLGRKLEIITSLGTRFKETGIIDYSALAKAAMPSPDVPISHYEKKPVSGTPKPDSAVTDTADRMFDEILKSVARDLPPLRGFGANDRIKG
jgi:hypothetical protein